MHGLIHVIFKEFIVDSFGHEIWAKILKRTDFESDHHILQMKQYEDDLILTAFSVGCEFANISTDVALQQFGAYFVVFATRSGFLPLLKSLGTNLHEFLSNLNILHHNVERDFASAIFPLFELEGLEGDVKADVYSFRLLYGSSRPGLHPLLKGALKKIAEMLFNCTLEISNVNGGISRSRSFVGSETVVCLEWELTVRNHGPPVMLTSEDGSTKAVSSKSAMGHTVHWPEAEAKSQAKSGFSFFDFHDALSSFWSCKCACSQDEDVGEMTLDDLQNGPACEDTLWAAEVERDSRRHRALIDQVCGGIRRSGSKHVSFQLDADDRMAIATALFRGVPAGKISAPWPDVEALQKATDFWMAYDKLDSYYSWSGDWITGGSDQPLLAKKAKIWFVSQSWPEPEGWTEMMGPSSSYSQAKAAEICCAAKDIASREMGDVTKWHEVGFWLDKCCIPQGDRELTTWCVNLLEEFIILSDGLIVLVPWTYFTRLWCVYEWVCFLLHHDPMNIEICADPFVRESTLPLYIKCISEFTVESCQCFHEPDKQVLLNKVDFYYKSRSAFERFLKFTAIALFVRCLASRRSGKAGRALKPWIQLARDSGFEELAGKLDMMVNLLPLCRREAVAQAKGRATRQIQSAITAKVDEWFEAEIVPLMLAERHAVVREQGLAYIEQLRRASGVSYGSSVWPNPET